MIAPPNPLHTLIAPLRNAPVPERAGPAQLELLLELGELLRALGPGGRPEALPLPPPARAGARPHAARVFRAALIVNLQDLLHHRLPPALLGGLPEAYERAWTSPPAKSLEDLAGRALALARAGQAALLPTVRLLRGLGYARAEVEAAYLELFRSGGADADLS